MTSILLLVFLGLAGGSLSARVPHIVVGNDLVSDIKYWPSQGSIRKLFGDHVCGCSLISETWAVTAARCVQSPPYEVAFGTIDRTKGGVVRPVAEIVIHEDYDNDRNSKRANDIAVIRFAAIKMSEQIKPIKLVADDKDPTFCFITGWGINQANASTMPQRLRQAKIHPLPLELCKETWPSRINDKHICAIGMPWNKTGLCDGDYGGPLVCVGSDQRLVGVASWAEDGCKGYYPSVFTYVYKFKAWIDTITGVQ